MGWLGVKSGRAHNYVVETWCSVLSKYLMVLQESSPSPLPTGTILAGLANTAALGLVLHLLGPQKSVLHIILRGVSGFVLGLLL